MINCDDVLAYLEQDFTRRHFSGYDEKHLNPTYAFTDAELGRLECLARLTKGEYPKNRTSKLLLDLSWAPSHLEGNSYSILDSHALIEYGHWAEGKPDDDAQMILNHRDAILWLLSAKELDIDFIKNTHRLLARQVDCTESRHFLPKEKCGTFRGYSDDGFEIVGTSYLAPQPEDSGLTFIDEQMNRLVETYHPISHPVNKCFYLATRIPYLQAFYDANKRTSRIVCNLPLISSSLSPLSFVDYDKFDYLKGLIAFYELGSEKVAKRDS